jgi:hypothetical protein
LSLRAEIAQCRRQIDFHAEYCPRKVESI